MANVKVEQPTVSAGDVLTEEQAKAINIWLGVYRDWTRVPTHQLLRGGETAGEARERQDVEVRRAAEAFYLTLRPRDTEFPKY